MAATLKCDTIQNASSSTANLTLDASGNATVGNTLVMGSSFKRNRIINGDMRVDQRNAGASVSIAGSSAYPVDRMNCAIAQGSGHTAQQSTTAPSGFTNSILITVGTGASPVAGSVSRIYQPIEGLNISDLGWGSASAKTITLSFWVRSSLTGTFAGGLYNNAGNRTYVFTYDISSANTFEYKTITIIGDTTGTWLTNNSAGIYVNWDLGSGSTYQGTAGSWAAGAAWATSSSVKLGATSGATFYITGVQLEVGSIATPYERQIYSDQLAQCQRYTYALTSDNASGPQNSFWSTVAFTGAGGGVGIVPFPVKMRATPTSFTYTATIGAYYVWIASSGAYQVLTAASINNVTCTSAGFFNFSISTGGNPGYTGYVLGDNTGNGRFIFSAEL